MYQPFYYYQYATLGSSIKGLTFGLTVLAGLIVTWILYRLYVGRRLKKMDAEYPMQPGARRRTSIIMSIIALFGMRRSQLILNPDSMKKLDPGVRNFVVIPGVFILVSLIMMTPIISVVQSHFSDVITVDSRNVATACQMWRSDDRLPKDAGRHVIINDSDKTLYLWLPDEHNRVDIIILPGEAVSVDRLPDAYLTKAGAAPEDIPENYMFLSPEGVREHVYYTID